MHRKVNADGVAFLDTEGFENVGHSAYFAEEFGVCDVGAFVGFVGFIDNSSLRRRSASKVWGQGKKMGGIKVDGFTNLRTCSVLHLMRSKRTLCRAI